MQKKAAGNLIALFTVTIWATTFVATKFLLDVFSPIEIMLLRFIVAYVCLALLFPHRLRTKSRRDEYLCAAAGFTGVCAYYLLENYALSFTQASNVSVVICAAPFFTAVAARICGERGHLSPVFCVGFLISALGVVFISFSNATELQLNPLGDLLAVLCALIWAVYSLLTQRLCMRGYQSGALTRRMFFYGTLFTLPMLVFCDLSTLPTRLARVSSLMNLLYLGVVASALCYVTWNLAIDRIGPVRCGIYLYLQPALTIVAGVVLLNETITLRAGIGIALVLVGLILSEYAARQRFKRLAADYRDKV